MDEVKKEIPAKAPAKKKPSIDSAQCAGCSVCIENCPMDCLALSRPTHHRDIHTFAYIIQGSTCIGCGICANVCPIKIIVMK